ncbi:MAG TPA: methyltransferase domain-containing protein [Nitrospirales bacterium]|nr:methyltransferase domain-containing protein [Nitrospirales bacterium]
MPIDTEAGYRQRIYGQYVTARDKPLAPLSLEGLRPRLPFFRQVIRRHFPSDRNAAILDLGCAHGAFLYPMHEAGYKGAKGVDAAIEQVAAARRLGIAGVEQGDVMSTLAVTPATSLDVVVSFDLIEHFTKAELIHLIDGVYRVLRPGGRWIIHTPNAEAPFGARMRYWDFTHELAFTRTSLSQVLRASGFASVHCYEDQPVPHGLKSAFRFLLWRLIRTGVLLYLAAETGALDHSAVFSQNLLAVARRA